MAGLEAIPNVDCYTRQWWSVAATTQSRWCYLQVCAPAISIRHVSMLSVLLADGVHQFCKIVCSAGYMSGDKGSYYNAVRPRIFRLVLLLQTSRIK